MRGITYRQQVMGRVFLGTEEFALVAGGKRVTHGYRLYVRIQSLKLAHQRALGLFSILG